MGMHLQGTQCAHVGHTTLDGLLQGTSLAMAIDNNHHLTGIHHGADTHSEGSLGNLVHVAVKEAAVGDDGILGERLLTGAGRERRARLIEGYPLQLINLYPL